MYTNDYEHFYHYSSLPLFQLNIESLHVCALLVTIGTKELKTTTHS